MSLFQQVFRICPANLKVRFWWLFCGMLLLACVETATVGLIAFYAAAVSDPQSTWQAVSSRSFIDIIPFASLLTASAKNLIGGLSFLVIGAVIFKNLFSGIITYQMARYGALTEAFFGQRLLESFLNRDYRWHVQWRTNLGRGFITPHLRVFSETLILIVLLAALLLVQPLVSLLFIVIQGSAGFVVYKLLRKGLDRSAQGCMQCDQELNRNVTRSIHGVKDVKMTGRFFCEWFFC